MRFKSRYKYRLYPNLEQKKALANTFGCARYAFNWALNLRIAEPMSYNESSARLTAHKKEIDWRSVRYRVYLYNRHSGISTPPSLV